MLGLAVLYDEETPHYAIDGNSYLLKGHELDEVYKVW
jgi:hypothetical protein